MRKKPIIAIDGPNGSGKTTISRELAIKMNFKHINTGAIYRAVALKMIHLGIDETREDEMLKICKAINIDFDFIDGKSIVILNGEDWTDRLYTLEVSTLTPKIAANKKLRESLLQMQRNFGKDGGIVAEGRDISSVIFPDAEWKFYITASFDIRLNRIMKVHSNEGNKLAKEDFANLLRESDLKDSIRPVAPLIQTKDAIYYDNSDSPSEYQDAIILEYYITHYKEIIENSKKLSILRLK